MGFGQNEVVRSESGVDSWLRAVLRHTKSTEIGIPCWYLWKERNNLNFNASAADPDSLVPKIGAWTSIVRTAFMKDNRRMEVAPNRQSSDVGWCPGPPQWHVLNTDGSVLPDSGRAAVGGVVRDELRRCKLAFSVNLGRCSITRAELRGIIVGLDIAWET
ncbi:Putative ribonuclease H protein At1g65750 [Linum perenne]